MKKVLSIALVLILVFTMFTGCGLVQRYLRLMEEPESEEPEITAEPAAEPNGEQDEDDVDIIEYEPVFKDGKVHADYLWSEDPEWLEAADRYNGFALNLTKAAVEKGHNDILSPFSLYNSLAILANGAAGKTRARMETVMGMRLEDINLYLETFNRLISKSGMGSIGDEYRQVYLASCLWFDNTKGPVLKSSFIDNINNYYDSGVSQGDFGNPDLLCSNINSWADKATGGAINDVISPDEIQPDSLFILLNALGAGGEWFFPFDESRTVPDFFTNFSGNKILTDKMNSVEEGWWHDDKSIGVIRSTFGGVDLLAILPNEGIDVYDYLEQLDENIITNYKNSYESVTDINEAKKTLTIQVTDLHIPKLEYDKKYNLNKAVESIGLEEIFDFSRADFSNMVEGPLSNEVQINDIQQFDNIYMDEHEIRAAAVTKTEGGLGAGGDYEIIYEHHEADFNRPFLYFLIGPNNTILFSGIVSELDGEDAAGAFRIKVKATTNIRIRSLPSTKGKKLGVVHEGDTMAAYEVKEAEGYNWYRIGENRWIADKDGKWIERIG